MYYNFYTFFYFNCFPIIYSFCQHYPESSFLKNFFKFKIQKIKFNLIFFKSKFSKHTISNNFLNVQNINLRELLSLTSKGIYIFQNFFNFLYKMYVQEGNHSQKSRINFIKPAFSIQNTACTKIYKARNIKDQAFRKNH